MGKKLDSINRVERRQGEKVLRFSIRKYRFGAASVAVATLMFLGTRVVSADGVNDNNQPVIGTSNQKEEGAPLVATGETEKNEKIGESAKNREVVGTNPLNNESAIDISSKSGTNSFNKKAEEKQTLDKTKLQEKITEAQELLDKVDKEKAPASTLAAIQADLERANAVLNNNNLELTQAEIDAATKKLKEQIFILRSMPKVDSPEGEGENTIANTGLRGPRNGDKTKEGSDFRLANVSLTWTNKDNLLSYQRFRASDGSGNARNDDRQFTENKVDMTARIETIDGSKYVVYDVFFNNDGRAMARLSTQQVYRVILPPKILDLQSSGAYKSDTIRDLYFDIYRRKDEDEGGTLSQNPEKFNKESTLSYHFLNDYDKSKG